MALLPYLFLILIVLMSGGIAVLADDVGRRLGKKRLHLPGLRPKRVAQIGTFFAGILVSIVTIAIVALLSSDVRQWIREGNLAIVHAQQARAELVTTQRTLDAEQRKDVELRQINARLTGETSRAQKDLQAEQQDAAALNQRMATIRTRLASLTARYRLANQRIAGLNQDVQKRQLALNILQTRADTMGSRIRTVDKRLKQVNAAVAQAKSEERVAIDEKRQADQEDMRLRQETDGLKKDKVALEKENAEASAHYAVVSKDLDEAKRALLQASNELTQTQGQLSQTQGQLAKAEHDEMVIWGISQAPRYSTPTYLRGAEVVRLAVPSGLSYRRAAEEMTTLLRMARIQAKNKGAAGHGSVPEALIVQHTDPESGKVRLPEELERVAAERITGAPTPMVLIATSSINAFKGEPVSLEIEAMPNPLIFPRNTLVAKAEADGRLDTDVIIRQLTLLGQKVQERAIQDKMIPRLGADELYGTVSSDEVLHLVNQVKAANRAVEVRAFADADTRAADPLRLRFSVR